MRCVRILGVYTLPSLSGREGGFPAGEESCGILRREEDDEEEEVDDDVELVGVTWSGGLPLAGGLDKSLGAGVGGVGVLSLADTLLWSPGSCLIGVLVTGPELM